MNYDYTDYLTEMDVRTILGKIYGDDVVNACFPQPEPDVDPKAVAREAASEFAATMAGMKDALMRVGFSEPIAEHMCLAAIAKS